MTRGRLLTLFAALVALLVLTPLIWMVAVLLGSAILKRWRISTFFIFYLVCAVSVAMTKLGIHWP